MKLLLKILLFLLFPFFASTQIQHGKLNKLTAAFKAAANDTVKITVLDSLMNYYSESNWDSALFFTNKALQISDKLKQPLWKANFLLNKSYFVNHQGNLPLALRFTNEALSLGQNEKNEKNLYIRPGEKFAGEPHKYRLNVLAGVAHLKGIIYAGSDIEKSNNYFKEEIRISAEIGADENLVNSNMNIGEGYFELGNLDSAFFYSFRALKYIYETGNKTYLGYILMVIGNIHLQQHQIDSAKYYYRSSIAVNREQNNLTVLSYVNLAYADLFKTAGPIDSVLLYSKTAFSLASSLKIAYIISSSASVISDAYKILGKADSALVYLSISKRIGDSLNNDHNQKLTQFQNIDFEEHDRLEQKARQNKDDKTRITVIALFTGVVLLVLLAMVFYRNNVQKQKANNLLQETLANLKSTQSQLIQSEKMASLGELTAGIAHEIQNPLILSTIFRN